MKTKLQFLVDVCGVRMEDGAMQGPTYIRFEDMMLSVATVYAETRIVDRRCEFAFERYDYSE